MKILLVSNEYPQPSRPGNPIISRLLNSTSADARVESIEFVPFTNSLSDFGSIRKAAKRHDIIHIHFSGIYSFLIWFALIGVRIPKYVTFHGTDIHVGELKTEKRRVARLKIKLNQKCSFASMFLFDGCGFVNESLMSYVPKWLMNKTRHKCFIQPLGVDYNLFRISDQKEAQEFLHIPISGKKYLLFSDLSHTPLKRRDIAEAIIAELGDNYELLIMCKVKPEMVPIYINAVDGILLTSDSEGSPNIVREALSLNKPVFSVDVGDVASQINGLSNSSIIERNPASAATVINNKLNNQQIEDTRVNLRHRLDFNQLASKIVDLYIEREHLS